MCNKKKEICMRRICPAYIQRKKNVQSRQRRYIRTRVELEHEIVLSASFRTLDEALGLWHRLPELIDHCQRFLSVLRDMAIHQPTTNESPRPTDAPSAMDRSEPASDLVVLQHSHDLVDELYRPRQATVADGETVIFDGGGVDF